VNKLTDADGENGENETRLDFAHDCGNLSKGDHGVWLKGVVKSEQCLEASSVIRLPLS
jgi:hypothetical protein